MAGNVSGIHVFAADTGPEALSLLDGVNNTFLTAFNTLSNFSNSYIDSGTVNALIVTVAAPQLFSYVDGIALMVKVAATNTGTAPTINVNGLGAKNIVNYDGSVLGVGQLVAGGWVTLQYEGTSGKFQTLSSSVPVGDVARLSATQTFTGVNTFNGKVAIAAPVSGFALSISTQASLNGININAAASTSALQGFQVNSTSVFTLGAAGGAGQFINGSAANDACFANYGGAGFIFSVNGGTSIQARITPSGALQSADAGGTLQAVGWLNIPQNLQGSYVCVLADSGKSIATTGSGATLAIPANSSVAYPLGTTLTFVNLAAGNISISINTDTLTIAATGTTGTRTLAPNGYATAYKATATGWLISGPGLS